MFIIKKTQQIEQEFKNIKHILNNTGHKGFLFNVKNAIEKARGKYIFLMNNDMIALSNYLSELLNVIENDNTIGIAGSKTLKIDNTIQECGVNLYNNAPIEFLGINQNANYQDEKTYIDCDYCSGCAIIFKKEIWDKTGGFDTNYEPAYYEDSDFAFNLKYNYNLKSVCVPKSKLYHFKGQTYQNHNSDKNRLYFLSKWGNYLATKN